MVIKMGNNLSMLNSHAQRYIQTVFESRLKQEGFVCPDDRLLCWYRLRHNGILNSIVFFARRSNLPLMLDIGYGIHPLFSKPVYIRNVLFSHRPMDDERFVEQAVVENCPINAMRYTRYSDDISVFAPGRDGRGIYTFDGILLPYMDGIQSIEDAYLYHLHRRLNHPLAHLSRYEHRLGTLSRSFVDMAVFVGDSQVYPHCKSRSIEAVNYYERLCSKYPKKSEYREELEGWKEIQTMFLNGSRDEYLSILESRKNSNINYITKELDVNNL